mgnify:CR=1 FL=1
MDFQGEFRGKGVVVTGACGVIGGWLAEAFAAEGARLCLSDARADRLAETAAALGADGPGHLTHATELTDAGSVADLVAHVRAAWGAPDIVVNNAAVYPSGFLLDIDVAEWDRIMGVNLRAPFLVAQGFARAMIETGRKGSIVNVSSGAARSMRKSVVPYCTSKTALDRFSRGLALELAEHGIRVNLVEPGFAPGSEVSELPAEHVAAVSANVPLGRTSQPGDAAAAVLFLCSAQAGYITGANLAVDGGNSLGSQVVYQAKKTAP